MKRYQIISAWIFIGLSILHTVVGFIANKPISEDVFWFFSAGMALFYVGAINLVQTKHHADNLIRTLTIISNLLMTIFVIAFGIYTLRKNLGNPLAWLLILNAAVSLILSIRNRSQERISS